MSQDDLAEINGIRPSVLLADGEEHEVGSTSSKSKYKVKRTSDHYHCSCPAWRNQPGVPVNARTCKHLKAFLGDAYENARIALKNGISSKNSKAKAKVSEKATSSRRKPPSKRKRNDEDEDADEVGEAEHKRSAKKGSRSSKRSKVGHGDLGVRPVRKDTNDRPESADELAEINGAKPLVVLLDGEQREVGSATSKSKYKVKRTLDHYHCTCPAWRNQARVPVNARTCKHLKTLLGDAYEDARLKSKTSNPSVESAGKTKKHASKTKPVSMSDRGQESETEEDSDVDMDGKDDQARNLGQDQEVQNKQHIQGESNPQALPADPGIDDELAEIDGHKPKVYLKDGEETEVGSLSSSTKYKVKRTWDHYYCSCPAWRNQGGAPVNARSCKHLKLLLGEDYESARLLWKNPSGPPPKGTAAKKKTKGKGKEEDAEGGEVPALLLANKWDLEDGPDPTGWWISEKLDGVRTYFDGKRMISRLGNPFTPPEWFLDKLPKDVTLDGELFGGRGVFQDTVSVVKTVNSPHWKTITFQVFDIPSLGSQPFESRLAHLQKLFGSDGTHASDHVVVVAHEEAKGREHVLEKLKEVERLGGEGLMLRKPESLYEGYRSSSLLKIKTFYDADAIVTGYGEGKGKNKGLTGALQCKMASGKTFSVGSGLSDKQRKNPPKIGTIIVYRFQELTRDGVPRFPTFVGIAADKDKPKDADIPEHKPVRNVTKKGEEE